MGLLDRLKKKENSDVATARKRAYDEEIKTVKVENKNAAIRRAVAEAKEKARSQSSSRTGSKSEKAVGIAKKVGSSIMALGNYGASLNWGGNEEPQEHSRRSEHPVKKGRKGKKVKKTTRPRSIASQFEMPEFPF